MARAWANKQTLKINEVVCSSLKSSQASVTFIGQGRACEQLEHTTAAPFWLIATPDTSLESTASALAKLPIDWTGCVVFHCSGAQPSAVLQPLAERGAIIASAHPIHSFANPEQSAASLSACFVGAEGDPQALAQIQPLFTALGCQWLEIDSQQKSVYHAASVFACNYLTTLMHAADRCLQQAGVDTPPGLALLQPLVQQTLNNIIQHGPKQALTGPVQRGDWPLVSQQSQAIAEFDQRLGALYQTLALATAPLAGQIPPDGLMDEASKLTQNALLAATEKPNKP